MDDHATDLEFLRELREAPMARLREIRVNLSYGGPLWQRIAVDRAIVARLGMPCALGS